MIAVAGDGALRRTGASCRQIMQAARVRSVAARALRVVRRCPSMQIVDRYQEHDSLA